MISLYGGALPLLATLKFFINIFIVINLKKTLVIFKSL